MPLTSRPIFSDLKFRHLLLLPLSGCSAPPWLLKTAIIHVISFPKEWGESNYIIIFALEKLPSAVISALQECLAVPEVRPPLAGGEKWFRHWSLHLCGASPPWSHGLSHNATPRGSQAAWESDLHVEGGAPLRPGDTSTVPTTLGSRLIPGKQPVGSTGSGIVHPKEVGQGFPGGASGRVPTCQSRRCDRDGA